ncbi:hypothetical protein HAX54_021149 [Datura stramonium]|uniref:Uncharacterized protein n=1 Tax=Datura stramonium TaxID=4076 RepID=A0ABS8USE2_DATST|nr:hypothetical protein [Datura stramonium]
MTVHKVSFLARLLVLGIFLLVNTLEHADAKACTRECGHFGFGICPRESDPKNPKACTLNCDPRIAYSRCPNSSGKTIIYPTGCTTCCTGYQGYYYSGLDGKFVCEGESIEPNTVSLVLKVNDDDLL